MLGMQADVVIVGGGIIGAATAYEAAKHGASVVVVEKDFVGAEQSSRNWGYTRQQGRHAAELELAVSALDLWPGLSEELGEETSWTRSGNLLVDDDPGAATKFARWAAVGARAGVPVEVLDHDGLSRVAPGLTGPWTAGLYTPNDGHAEPVLAMKAYDKALRRVGVDVRTGRTAVSLITTFGAVVGVETSDGPVYGARGSSPPGPGHGGCCARSGSGCRCSGCVPASPLRHPLSRGPRRRCGPPDVRSGRASTAGSRSLRRGPVMWT